MDHEDLSEHEMATLLDAALTSSTSQLRSHVTPEEEQKFVSAMKEPEFRALLNGYMKEISDPQYRAETEQYLAQLEKEHKVPMDKQLVKPTAGFVVKTRWDTTHKVFVNVCSSDKMQPPSSTKVLTGPEGTSWSLPYSLGPERLETDKGGTDVPTFDVCFHPRVVEYAMARVDYRHMVIGTCFDAVEKVLRDSRHRPYALVERKYHILKGVYYKSGDPITMCVRRDIESMDVQGKHNVNVNASERDDKEQLITTLTRDQAKDSVMKLRTSGEQTDDSTRLIEEVSRTHLKSKQEPKLEKKMLMEHQLIYRGRFELLHHMQADVDNQVPEDRFRPKELVIEVKFPLSSSAKGLDLDVSDQMLRLSADPCVVGDYEPLELALPYPVIEDKGCARFDRKKHKLIVTLPVQPPPLKPKLQSVSLVLQDKDDDQEEDEEPAQSVAAMPKKSGKLASPQKTEGDDEFRMLRETALMVANDPQVVAHTQRQLQQHAPVLETRSLATTALPGNESNVDVPPLETESSTTLTAVDPIQPSFETHDTAECLSYIVDVAGIDSSSVKLTFPSTSSLVLQFSDNEKRVYELTVAVIPVEFEPSTADFDVASDNMVLILHKKGSAIAAIPQKLEEIETPAPVSPLAAARFQNQLLYELD